MEKRIASTALLLSLLIPAGIGTAASAPPIAPVVNNVVVQADQTTATKRAFNSAIIEISNNRLLLTYDNYTGVTDDSPGEISGKISSDGGRTWGEPYLIQENIGAKNVTNQGIIRLKSGALALFFAKNDRPGPIMMYMKRSFDEGLTWEQPRNITPIYGNYVTANDRAIMLSSGRLFIPIAGVTSAVPGVSGAYSIYSDDEGVTWSIGQFVNLSSSWIASEPVAVELRDKRTMMLVRTSQGLYKVYSSDGGATWGTAMKLDIQNTLSAPAMIKRVPYQDGDRLVLVYNSTSTNQRSQLSMAVSNDEGETWGNIVNLESGLVSAYPSLLASNGELLITYYTVRILNGAEGTYTLPLKLQIWNTAVVFGPNTAPAAQDAAFYTRNNASVSGSVYASDADGDELVYSIVDNGLKGVAAITDAQRGAFTYTPHAGQSGTDRFTFRAFDGTAYSNTATVTVSVYGAQTTLTGASSVRPGKKFNVTYGLSQAAEPVYAQDIRLNYDAAVMEFESAKAVRSGTDIAWIDQSESGKLRLLVTSLGADRAVTGEAQLIELSFKAKKDMQATGVISVANAVWGNKQGNESEAAPSMISIRIGDGEEFDGDVNLDGKTTVGDLAIIAFHYGKNKNSPDWELAKQADLNGDDKIDHRDVTAAVNGIVDEVE